MPQHDIVSLRACTVALRLKLVGPGTGRAQPFKSQAPSAPWKALDIGTASTSSRLKTLLCLQSPRIPGSSVEARWVRIYRTWADRLTRALVLPSEDPELWSLDKMAVPHHGKNLIAFMTAW